MVWKIVDCVRVLSYFGTLLMVQFLLEAKFWLPEDAAMDFEMS